MKAKIDRVTITGPDDSIRPDQLIPLTKEFPFVEWGILISKSQQGYPRFPAPPWIRELQALKTDLPSLSLHICGKWVRDLLLGRNELPIYSLNGFERIQLNFHAENAECDPAAFRQALVTIPGNRQFIFQLDGANGNKHLEGILAENDGEDRVIAVPLFDISGGSGVLPDKWPKPTYLDDLPYAYYGYAGGLGPDNLEEQIPKIIAAAGDDCPRIWIDMETNVRSESDQLFDLAKVRRCLEIAAPFVR